MRFRKVNIAKSLASPGVTEPGIYSGPKRKKDSMFGQYSFTAIGSALPGETGGVVKRAITPPPTGIMQADIKLMEANRFAEFVGYHGFSSDEIKDHIVGKEEELVEYQGKLSQAKADQEKWSKMSQECFQLRSRFRSCKNNLDFSKKEIENSLKDAQSRVLSYSERVDIINSELDVLRSDLSEQLSLEKQEAQADAAGEERTQERTQSALLYVGIAAGLGLTIFLARKLI